MKKAFLVLGFVSALCLSSCGRTSQQQENPFGDVPMTINLTSSAFKEGEMIPKQYTGEGKDVSPPLSWKEIPDGTKCFALIVDDPDAPRATPWVHWVIFNIPADVHHLDEGVETKRELPDGAKQGKNDFGNIGYGGPYPPKGKPHRYYFKLYALDTKINLPAGIDKGQLEGAMKDHILARGQLMGKYQIPRD